MMDTLSPDDSQAARKALEARGLRYSETKFLRHVRSGNTECVRLYLKAGMSPDARLDGESALAASINAGHFDVTRLLLEWRAQPVTLLDGLKARDTRKDRWEKLASLAGCFTFISSLLVAGIGWYFTHSYNERQFEHGKSQSARDQQNRDYQNQIAELQAARDQQNKDYQNRIAEMQTVERMIPHLTRDESSKRAALIAIGALATPTLAAKIAEAYGGQGSIDALERMAATLDTASAAPAVSALTTLATTESADAEGPAHSALAAVLADREKAIVRIAIDGAEACNGFLIAGDGGWVVTPGYCLGKGTASQVIVTDRDGTAASPKRISLSPDGLMAFIETGSRAPRGLTLSAITPRVGDAVVQLGVDLASDKLGVITGKIVATGALKFGRFGAGPSLVVEAPGLITSLDPGKRRLMGSAGAPLLDSEGNVACMTFQSDGSNQNEQCLAASVIATASASLPR